VAYTDPKINDAQEPFRSALAGLLAEAEGRIRIGNAWRSTARQAYLYDRWIRRVPGQAKAARPGTSNHEYGLAADLEGDLRLAAQLAPKYGLHFPVTGENWHIEKRGANRHTKPAPWSPGAPPPPAGWTPPPFPGTIRKGSPTERVAVWRVVLGALGYKGFKVGFYPWSGVLTLATKRFQRHHGLKADGVVGPKTWAKAIEVLRSKRIKAGLPV